MEIEYDKNTVLGKGGFSIVFLGRLKGCQMAIKRVQLQDVCENEEKALQQLDHPNIVKLFYSESDDIFKYNF
jgi:hypothetical protein